VAYIPQFWTGGGAAVFVLVMVGGALYTAGAIVYGLRKPDPSPRWFGFHEVFHAFTVLAFISHYIGISLAVHAGVS
jgi:hemolysin III